MTDINTDLGGDVQRGLKLLSKKARGLHPRYQVQSLKRVATRALNQAAFIRSPEMRMWYDAANEEEAKTLDAKARDAIAAMQHLNREHKLGYGG